MMLTEKLPKYLLDHQAKMTSMTVTSKEILPSNQRQTIEQAKFAYSPLVKAFEKQTKTIEDQGKKQIDALKDLKTIKKNKQEQLRTNLVISFQYKKKKLINY